MIYEALVTVQNKSTDITSSIIAEDITDHWKYRVYEWIHLKKIFFSNQLQDACKHCIALTILNYLFKSVLCI